MRFNLDEWHIHLFGQDVTDINHDSRHETIEAIQWTVAARALVLGVNVILDFGCWVRSQRDDFRLRAAQLGADFKLHYPATSLEVILARLAVRNAELPPNTFYIPEVLLKEWATFFEPPFPDELPYTFIY